MNKLFSLFRPARLHPFERRALDALKAKMSSAAAAKLATQLDSIDRIERLTEGKEVNLYSKRWTTPARGDGDRFPDRESEAPLAAVWMTRVGSSARLKVEVWLADGHLFSLGFAMPPAAFFESKDLDAVDVEIVDVTIWRDPMAPGDDAAAVSRPSARAIPPWVDASIPSDYERVIDGSNQVPAEEWNVASPDAIRKVFLPTANYYLMAERASPPAGALALREGEGVSTIYWIDLETQEIRPMGTSMMAALKSVSAGRG